MHLSKQVFLIYIFLGSLGINASSALAQSQVTYKQVEAVLRPIVVEKAEWALLQEPVTVTANHASRSAGGIHDFYSEGDYWWPNPEDPDGPYIQRDGMTNPDNFTAHREAMIRFSQIIGALASAYKITGDEKYAAHAFTHLYAWFVDPDLKMNPSLNFAQAIKGRVTGRGIGIIDTIHLMEVAQGLEVVQGSIAADPDLVLEIKKWFGDYLTWLTTHPYGRDESATKNNHATCYYMQVASFAKLTANKDLLEMCRDEFENRLLPNQMAENGSFPLELDRTKPYGYSLFNLDAMTTLAWILTDGSRNMMNFETASGKSIPQGISFLSPYVQDKSNWPYSKDVMYWDNWPVAHPFLLFGALNFDNSEWFELWKQLDHDPEIPEVVRNLPIRNPLIWMKKDLSGFLGCEYSGTSSR